MRGAQRAASETTRYAGGAKRLYKAAPSPDTCDCSGRKESESRGRWWRMAQKACSLPRTKWMRRRRVVFAPKSRDFSKKMNKIARQTALFSALSKRVADGEFFIVDNIAVADGKTKEMVAFLDAFKFDKTVLMVMNDNDALVIRAARNLKKLQTLPVDQLNTYDVVKNAVVVIAKDAVEKLQEVYGE